MHAHRRFASSLVTLFVLLLALPVAAQGSWQPGELGSARVRLGYFMPDGDGRYWSDTALDFTGSVSDFEDLSLGFDFIWRFSPTSGLLFTSSIYSGSSTRAYHDWVDDRGRPISHTAELSTFDLGVAWVVQGRTNPVRPYFGLGGGFVFWELTEAGSFVDFGDPELPIVWASYYDDGATLAALALAGLELRVSRGFSLLVEGRYRFADDELGGAFAGVGDLDLSGFEASAGFAWNF